MAEFPYMVMTAIEAARFREATQTAPARLDPVPIKGGQHAGKYALPERVKYDPAFADHRDAFAFIDVLVLDPAVAFPAPPEE